MEIFLYFHP